MSLYHKYRPTELSQVRGNEELVHSLERMLAVPKKFPHAILMHGETGCGKTTIGRIISDVLGCVGDDYTEINSSDFRGIDTVRELIRSSQYAPTRGKCKVYLIDECFAKGTLVETENGKIPIEDIKVYDSVYSLAGTDVVKHIFKNKVELNRVMRLVFDNGAEIYCSKDHLFFTEKGWVKACLLQKDSLILSFNSLLMSDINLQNNERANKEMSMVQQSFEKESKEMLFNKLCKSIKRIQQTCKNHFNRMSDLWEFYGVLFQQTRKVQPEVLQQGMCGGLQLNQQCRFYKDKRTEETDFFQEGSILKNQRREKSNKEMFSENENQQSFIQSKEHRKSKRNKKNKRNFARLVWGTWRKWKLYILSGSFSNLFRMENGTSNSNRSQSFRQKWYIYLLQSGRRKSEIKNSNRVGWCSSQIEEEYIKRSKERKCTEGIRLESSAIYQQGSNDKHFQGIITDTERNQGFVTFYDLEMTNHPSYFVNGLAVHNCHKMTNDAQNAMLKILEDTPSHIYFILCTTEVNKLISAIRGRCQEFQVKVLSDEDMKGLLRFIVKSEKEKLNTEIYEQIVQDSMGHPRNAINVLEKVLAADPDQRLAVAKKTADTQSQAIELARLLVNRNTTWKQVNVVLKGLKDQEAEGIRRVVLGYAQAILLNKEDDRCGLVMECFMEPNFTNGFPQLTYNCYQVIKGM